MNFGTWFFPAKGIGLIFFFYQEGEGGGMNHKMACLNLNQWDFKDGHLDA